MSTSAMSVMTADGAASSGGGPTNINALLSELRMQAEMTQQLLDDERRSSERLDADFAAVRHFMQRYGFKDHHPTSAPTAAAAGAGAAGGRRASQQQHDAGAGAGSGMPPLGGGHHAAGTRRTGSAGDALTDAGSSTNMSRGGSGSGAGAGAAGGRAGVSEASPDPVFSGHYPHRAGLQGPMQTPPSGPSVAGAGGAPAYVVATPRPAATGIVSGIRAGGGAQASNASPFVLSGVDPLQAPSVAAGSPFDRRGSTTSSSHVVSISPTRRGANRPPTAASLSALGGNGSGRDTRSERDGDATMYSALHRPLASGGGGRGISPSYPFQQQQRPLGGVASPDGAGALQSRKGYGSTGSGAPRGGLGATPSHLVAGVADQPSIVEGDEPSLISPTRGTTTTPPKGRGPSPAAAQPINTTREDGGSGEKKLRAVSMAADASPRAKSGSRVTIAANRLSDGPTSSDRHRHLDSNEARTTSPPFPASQLYNGVMDTPHATKGGAAAVAAHADGGEDNDSDDGRSTTYDDTASVSEFGGHHPHVGRRHILRDDNVVVSPEAKRQAHIARRAEKEQKYRDYYLGHIGYAGGGARGLSTDTAYSTMSTDTTTTTGAAAADTHGSRAAADPMLVSRVADELVRRWRAGATGAATSSGSMDGAKPQSSPFPPAAAPLPAAAATAGTSSAYRSGPTSRSNLPSALELIAAGMPTPTLAPAVAPLSPIVVEPLDPSDAAARLVQRVLPPSFLANLERQMRRADRKEARAAVHAERQRRRTEWERWQRSRQQYGDAAGPPPMPPVMSDSPTDSDAEGDGEGSRRASRRQRAQMAALFAALGQPADVAPEVASAAALAVGSTAFLPANRRQQLRAFNPSAADADAQSRNAFGPIGPASDAVVASAAGADAIEASLVRSVFAAPSDDRALEIATRACALRHATTQRDLAALARFTAVRAREAAQDAEADALAHFTERCVLEHRAMGHAALFLHEQRLLGPLERRWRDTVDALGEDEVGEAEAFGDGEVEEDII